MNFMLGCNYWASHAGTHMWKNWDSKIVDTDLKKLADSGMNTIRVFPTWNDFQPVVPLYKNNGHLKEFSMRTCEDAKNEYFVSEKMMQNFGEFCTLAEKHNIKLVVGLITGWMSGKLYVPEALYGRNLYNDPVALMFQSKFIIAFVNRFKSKNIIIAWDLGNECNCLSDDLNDSNLAYMWTAYVSNAIKANDNTRPIISGMHSLEVEGVWTIKTQGELTDMLTTHPYPHWVYHGESRKIAHPKTMLQPTIESNLYADVSGKPCLVEEIGLMGPNICNEKLSADFIRVNMLLNWANGQTGLMWWCANEQSQLDFEPYEWNMTERELGMFDVNGNPKPVADEMLVFSKFLSSFKGCLPPKQIDATVLLSAEQDQWAIALMSGVLAAQAGVQVKYKYAFDDIEKSEIYYLPSLQAGAPMKKSVYLKLKKHVYEGADIYISNGTGFLTELEEFTGIRVEDSSMQSQTSFASYANNKLKFSSSRHRDISLVGENAEVIIEDENNKPILTCNRYGKGLVYYLNCDLEQMLVSSSAPLTDNYSDIYKLVAKNKLKNKPIFSNNKNVIVIHNPSENSGYCTAVNLNDYEVKTPLKFIDNLNCETIYGDYKTMKPYHGVVIKYSFL